MSPYPVHAAPTIHCHRLKGAVVTVSCDALKSNDVITLATRADIHGRALAIFKFLASSGTETACVHSQASETGVQVSHTDRGMCSTAELEHTRTHGMAILRCRCPV